MDKRSERRITQKIEFFVYVDECAQEPDLVGESFSCDASDVSPHGFRLLCEKPLYVGNVLDITIGVGEPFVMYLLKGEIRWVHEETGIHHLGIRLIEDDDTDYEGWLRNFDDVFLDIADHWS